ncbi:DUF4292 domain-containing protein [Fibrella forsythiae]|uniref:DUF4292 domain-containing protein n=1 Tax=Fibrella forsythiae TaxID=2817061 RepID=A0ABS3JHY5_9BACT|nr:DUF4292 domain-containing protein [Fibrella forsythiae]MBO0949620.1 DUF4292 domain-containing protein [Fibrella forsythiae]
MNRVLLYALLASTLVLQAGCHRQRIKNTPPAATLSADTVAISQPQPTTTNPAPPDAVTTTAPIASTTLARPGIDEARANVAEIDFTYLTAKSKLSFKNKTQDISNANLNLRVRKDSLIWISISKLGIEAVRALITRDSVEIMDKLERRYAVYDFPTLSRQFNFDMNFDLLQALIVGNLPLPKRPAQKIKKERDYLLLRQSAGKVLVENYIGENDRKLKRLMVTEQPTKNALRLDYEDFNMLNNFLFPYSSLVTLDYQSQADGQFYQTLIQIKHNKVELIDKDPGFPFSIPAKYQRN